MSNAHDADINRLTHLFVEFYDKLSSWEQSVVKGKGLTPAQMHALEILGVHGPMRMKELAERMGVTTGTLTVQADRLEKKKLIIRKPHATDRRSFLIEMTEAGAVLFQEHDRLHTGLTSDVTSSLSDEERAMLIRCLEQINKAF